MKGFIKITNLRGQIIYLNIDYIIKFNELPSKNGTKNTVIRVTSGQEVATLLTNTSAEEIANMIEISKG
ncbi:hypothetical protein [Flavobacterium sp. 1355]|uniref:hypothetical protein n=1 Tax=Flavobacterium sp. 1355 TaxID=2806571 RepID=UPI001AE8473B|nr:hypothetical protein [Flavobacterium sp. 1355]MBP1222908.1 uncharacterized protein YlzI (FlbEa/FlbD family) [Flavobacterium sp. 1355]